MCSEQHHVPRVAVISGGSRGIGLGIAKRLTKEGYDLAIIGKRDEADVDSLEVLRQTGRDIIYCRGDIASTADIAAIVQQVLDHFPAYTCWLIMPVSLPEEEKTSFEPRSKATTK